MKTVELKDLKKGDFIINIGIVENVTEYQNGILLILSYSIIRTRQIHYVVKATEVTIKA